MELALEKEGYIYCSTCRATLVDPEEVRAHAARGHELHFGALVDEAFSEAAAAD